MRDHQAIIDAARSYVRQGGRAYSDALRELADDFVALSREVESRLQRCEDLLRRGLVGEAIHQAELDPPVLDLVTLTDFQGRDRFEEILRDHGLGEPPRADLQRARALNHAYEEHNLTADLLREYRRLTLMRAGTADRLDVLRKLAAVNPTNGNWAEDMKALEKPALDDLKKRIRDAVAVGDAAALIDAQAKLASGNWAATEVPALVESLRQQVAQFSQEKIKQELPKLLKELRRSQEDGDPARVQAAINRLSSELAAAMVPDGDPAYLAVQQANGWLQDEYARRETQAAFDAEVQAFQARLSNPKITAEQIETGYERLERFGLPMPSGLKAMMRRIEQREEKAAAAREAKIAGAVNLTLLLIAVPVGLALAAMIGVMVFRALRAG